GYPATVQRWRELEIELVDGSPEILAGVDEALRAAGATPARAPSKLARALADRYPALRRLTGRTTTKEQTLIRYLRKQRDAIADNEPGVRRGDPDAVHDMRVATRRLRSTLRTFRSLFDRSRTDLLRDELQWLGGELGAVRDGDGMVKRLAAEVAAVPPELVVGPVAERIRERMTPTGACGCTTRARRTSGPGTRPRRLAAGPVAGWRNGSPRCRTYSAPIRTRSSPARCCATSACGRIS